MLFNGNKQLSTSNNPELKSLIHYLPKLFPSDEGKWFHDSESDGFEKTRLGVIYRAGKHSESEGFDLKIFLL